MKQSDQTVQAGIQGAMAEMEARDFSKIAGLGKFFDLVHRCCTEEINEILDHLLENADRNCQRQRDLHALMHAHGKSRSQY